MKSFSHSSGFLAVTAILVNYCGCQDLSSLAVQSGHRDTASATAVTDHSCQGPYSGTTGPEQVHRSEARWPQSGAIETQLCNFHSVYFDP